MGLGLGWSEVELTCLCQAWLRITRDSVVGTDQKGGYFYGDVRNEYLNLMRACAELPLTTEGTVGAVTKTWDKVKKEASAFASSFLALQRLQLTGNPSQKAVVQGALAYSKGEDIYEAIRSHQARLDGNEPETGVKRKCYPLEKYVPCWKVLRLSDKWSGAAGAAAAGIGTRSSPDGSGHSDNDVDTDDPTDGPRKTGKVGGAARTFDPRTTGSKAAKRGRMEDLAAAREVQASTEALNTIATASDERSAIILFNQPGVRDTEEAKLIMRTKARQMPVAAGVPVGPPHARSWTPDPLPAAVAAYAATGVASVYEVRDDDDNDTERPPPPPSAAPLAVAPPRIPADKPTAEQASPADSSALHGPVAASPDRAAARVRARDDPSPRPVRGEDGLSAPFSRAAKAQLTKAMAAAGKASGSLGSNLPLADEDSYDSGLSSPSGRKSVAIWIPVL